MVFNSIESTHKVDFKTVKPKYACFFCQNPNHYGTECPEYKTKDAPLKFFKNAERCVKCLQRGYNPNDCKEPKECIRCKEKHPSILCPKCFERKDYLYSKNSHTNFSQTFIRSEGETKLNQTDCLESTISEDISPDPDLSLNKSTCPTEKIY